MIKDKIKEILMKNFSRGHVNKATDEIYDLIKCENSEGGIKEIIIDKPHAINFTMCNHVRGEIVVTG